MVCGPVRRRAPRLAIQLDNLDLLSRRHSERMANRSSYCFGGCIEMTLSFFPLPPSLPLFLIRTESHDQATCPSSSWTPTDVTGSSSRGYVGAVQQISHIRILSRNGKNFTVTDSHSIPCLLYNTASSYPSDFVIVIRFATIFSELSF